MYVVYVFVHRKFPCGTVGIVSCQPLLGATVPLVDWAYCTVVFWMPLPAVPCCPVLATLTVKVLVIVIP